MCVVVALTCGKRLSKRYTFYVDAFVVDFEVLVFYVGMCMSISTADIHSHLYIIYIY